MARDPSVFSTAVPIARVPLRVALVASFVVAGESGHQFLLVLVDDVLDELIGATATQSRGHATVMGDHHVTVLAPRPVEALGFPHVDSLLRSLRRSPFGSLISRA